MDKGYNLKGYICFCNNEDYLKYCINSLQVFPSHSNQFKDVF